MLISSSEDRLKGLLPLQDMEKNHEGGSDAAFSDRETMAKALGTTVAFIEAMEKQVEPSQLPQVPSTELTLMGLMNAVDSMPPDMVGFMTGPLAKKLKVPVKVRSCEES